MIVGRCPPVKTVPYTCPPGATDTSQCIYGEHNAKDSSLFYHVLDNDADDDLHYITKDHTMAHSRWLLRLHPTAQSQWATLDLRTQV